MVGMGGLSFKDTTVGGGGWPGAGFMARHGHGGDPGSVGDWERRRCPRHGGCDRIGDGHSLLSVVGRGGGTKHAVRSTNDAPRTLFDGP